MVYSGSNQEASVAAEAEEEGKVIEDHIGRRNSGQITLDLRGLGKDFGSHRMKLTLESLS